MKFQFTIPLFTFYRRLLLIALFPGIAQTQNLVENPSFEEVNFLNEGEMWKTLNGREFTEMSKSWLSPHSSSPDYIQFGKGKTYFFKEYNAKVKNYKPINGNRAVGISVYGCHRKSGACREYVQAELLKPLEVGEEYYVEFWVSRIRNGAVINNLGIYFSETRPKDIHIELEGYTPQILENGLIGEQPFKWQKISGTFRAKKPFTYITIGNLFTDSETKLLKEEERKTALAYYFVDHVNVIPTKARLNEYNIDWSKIEVGKSYLSNQILFEFGKTTLLQESFAELNSLGQFMLQKPNLIIEITGHTDDIGTSTFNLELSTDRANVIQAYLISKGIDQSRIQTNGVGSSQPVPKSKTAEGIRLNRRVEFTFKAVSNIGNYPARGY